jgi:hypothetical protein
MDRGQDLDDCGDWMNSRFDGEIPPIAVVRSAARMRIQPLKVRQIIQPGKPTLPKSPMEGT